MARIDPDILREVEASLRDIEVGASLKTASMPISAYAKAIEDVIERDPELKPELQAALDHVGESLAAIHRAILFIDARMIARREKLGLST